MDRFVFVCVGAAMMGLGLCMVVRPGWVVLNSRDADDDRPLTGSEFWATRVAGIVMVMVCGYGLYAIATGMPGGDAGAP